MARLSVLVALFLAPVLATAAALNVAPVRLELAPGEASGTIQVRNSGDRIAVMQAQAFAWAQNGDQNADQNADQNGGQDDSYSPTEALIVTPAVFSVAPNQVQVLRVGLRGTRSGDTEQAYRLIMKEIPPPATGSSPGLRIALRINMPVFVLPASDIRSDDRWQATRLGNDSLRLTISNQGNAHLQVTQLNLAAQGHALGLTEGAPSLMYVLPGQTQSWTLKTLKPLPPAGQPIQIRAETNQGSSDEQVELGS